MADLDFAKVIQRLGLTTGDDSGDPDKDPNVVWCDAGRIQIVPIESETYVKVADGSPVPWTGGNAVIECAISQDADPDGDNYYEDGAGYLLYNGDPYVWVVDLTSDKVNPRIIEGATHRINYVNVAADGTPVAFPSVTVRFTAAGDGVSEGAVNDITVLSPVIPGTASPITVGPRGVGIAGVAIVDGTDLEVELSDGSTVNAGELPVGPGGSDPGVATYFANPASETSAQAGEAALDPDHPLGAAIAELIADIPTEAP